MQWVKQKTFRARFISCVKPKISSAVFLAHMEDTYGGRALLKAYDCTSGLSIPAVFFFFLFCISADCSFNGSHDSYNVYDGL